MNKKLLFSLIAIGIGSTLIVSAATASYRVKRGDSWESIAAKYNLTVQQLADLNQPTVGTRLNVPVVVPVTPTSTPTSTSPTPPPPPPPTPTPVPPPATTLQWGVFNNDKSFSPTPQWTETFTNQSFPSDSGNLVIFIEPAFTDSQVIAGQFDNQLKSFTTASLSHNGQIIVALGEEVNCDNVDGWGGGTKGNTVQSTITAFQHEVATIKAINPAIKIAFSTNNDSCFNLPPATSYYPGDAYVDIVGVDGFDFGGQTWSQALIHSITPLQQFNKPIWILSEGVVTKDNQSQFLKDTFAIAPTLGVQGVMYFNYSDPGDNFVLGSSAITTLKTLVQ